VSVSRDCICKSNSDACFSTSEVFGSILFFVFSHIDFAAQYIHGADLSSHHARFSHKCSNHLSSPLNGPLVGTECLKTFATIFHAVVATAAKVGILSLIHFTRLLIK
jgi:hypothetical protein